METSQNIDFQDAPMDFFWKEAVTLSLREKKKKNHFSPEG